MYLSIILLMNVISINESDNMIKFYEYYKDNYKIIIPNIYEHSENIIVMDYYDGENK